ncbi:hypothetical protein GF407_02750 [candidate division KSB1 bacterium]|nr:hypothetical protein [candidate division KSB1 bacterium]
MKAYQIFSIILVLMVFNSVLAQLEVKNNSGTTVMTVDANGKLTAETLKLNGNSPATGKVLYMDDNSGNVVLSEQPSTGEFLKWNGSQTGWVTDVPPAFWNGTVNTSSVIQRGGDVKIGGSGTTMIGKLDLPESQSKKTIRTVGNKNLSHRTNCWIINNNNDDISLGNFGLMSQVKEPESSIGYFNGAIAGRVEYGGNILAQGEVGKVQMVKSSDEKAHGWLSAVMGTINASNAQPWMDDQPGGGAAAAVRGYVVGGSDPHVYAGVFQGGTTIIEEMASSGGDYAEWIEKEEATKAGDLIGINLDTGKSRKYREGDLFVGIHSENPAVIGNRLKNDMQDTHCLVALVGQVNIDPSQVTIRNRVVRTKDDKMVGVLLNNDKILLKQHL